MPKTKQKKNKKLSFDLIVVGAGLAGGTAALSAARKGLKVALIERGQTPGGKNYFGGTVYTHALEEVFPDFWKRNPPLERPVTEAGYWMLSETGMTRITVQGGELLKNPADAYIGMMAKFNAWWVEQAQAEGVFLIPKTLVVDFIRDARGAIIGVQTDRPEGEVYAPVTIICEGVNNILTQKAGLIDHDLRPETVALVVKQLISVPAEDINARFGLPDSDHGLAVSVIGDISLGLTGLGFIYTCKSSVSLGVGVDLDVLDNHHARPYDLMQRFLKHPQIAPLVAGGQMMEYGGHLIPEGGWRQMPKLYGDGVLVAGDAAAMVNALHWEGTNMATVAGKLAGEAAFEAHQRKDYSAGSLKVYQDKLNDSFILRDLRQYRNFSHFLNTHHDFMDVYPGFINTALGKFFSGFGQPKRQLYRDILRSLTRRKPLLRAVGDIVSFGRTIIGW
ncbi:MAG: FAD-dependent oxidoreductase [Anaerolineaceae bacterium]|nr:FAD-dependent oxidoreductase [Anaerolineaceae bacterium]MBN2677247.1 FAD-dependent oxidoreductase [Anaerolineaceae bacterium]